MPVRKIPKNYRNITGVHASDKSIGEAQFESTLERDFVTVLEFSPDIDQFEVQPVTIKWQTSDQVHHKHTPDALIYFKPEINRIPWLCEVKYRSDIAKNWAEYKPKFKQGIHLAKEHGWRYKIITEVEVRTPFLGNWQFLMRFKTIKPTDTAISSILHRLSEQQTSTPSALLTSLATDKYAQAELIPTLWHLIANRLIGADLQIELTMQSSIWSLS